MESQIVPHPLPSKFPTTPAVLILIYIYEYKKGFWSKIVLLPDVGVMKKGNWCFMISFPPKVGRRYHVKDLKPYSHVTKFSLIFITDILTDIR